MSTHHEADRLAEKIKHLGHNVQASAPQAAGADAASLLALKQWLIEKGWWNKLPMSWFNALDMAIEHPAPQVREQAALPAVSEALEEDLNDLLMAAHAYENAFVRCGANPELLSDLIKKKQGFSARLAALSQGTTTAAGVGDYYSEEADDIAQSEARRAARVAGVGEQAKAEPMSDDAIVRVFDRYSSVIDFYKDRGINFARAILAEAGIKEKTNG